MNIITNVIRLTDKKTDKRKGSGLFEGQMENTLDIHGKVTHPPKKNSGNNNKNH